VMPSQALDGELRRVVAAAASVGLRGVVARPLAGGYASPWYSIGDKVEWTRSLSAPPPLSNADKVLYPRDGIAKKEIVAYYKDIAPTLVPYLIDRPVVIQRWPDGIDEFDWYQHRVPPRAPDYIRPAWVDGVRRCVLENSDALCWMANQAGLVFHGFASRLASLERPDFVIVDLDPGDRSTWWADLVEVAVAVRRTLELLELPSVVKTSGQRGLHILIPLALETDFPTADAFGQSIASLIARLMPDKVTLEMEKEKRRGRLLFDHKQFKAKTLVIPYSLRGADGAPVSTPLAWDEVTPTLDPRAFTLRTLRARLDAKGDLAAPLLAGTARLERALAQLRAQ
jgi:bifunctional non-homologous end joining protein LigD